MAAVQEWLVSVGTLLVGLVWSYFSQLKKQQLDEQRTNDLQNIAGQLGLSFVGSDHEDLDSRLERSRLASLGTDPSVANRMSGEIEETMVSIFDYQQTIGSGKNRQRVRQTVIGLQGPGNKGPTFVLSREKAWWNRPLFGEYCDINFETHPTFSSSYQLSGTDETAIREWFTDDVLTFFEQHPGLITEGSGNKLLYYRDQVTVEPDQMQSFLNEALHCYRCLNR